MAIVDNSEQLRHLSFCEDLSISDRFGNISDHFHDLDWLNNLNLRIKKLNLDSWDIGSLSCIKSTLTYNSGHHWISETRYWDLDGNLLSWVPEYSHLTHLTFQRPVSDKILQSIFEHMVRFTPDFCIEFKDGDEFLVSCFYNASTDKLENVNPQCK